MPDFTDEVSETTSQLFSSAEFAHYADHRDKLLDRVQADLDVLEDRLRPLREERTAEQSRLELRRTHMRITVGLSVIVAAASWVPASRAVNSMQTATTSNAAEVFFSWVVALALFVTGIAIYGVGRRRFAQQARLAQLARVHYARELAAAVTEAVTTAINGELGPAGIVAFPTQAPRLVELDTSTITPSATVSYVQDFIKSHESSAIGLAGTRGSGKSTVMRALRKDEQLSRYLEIVPAPVKYDEGEFIRRLLFEVAKLIAGPSVKVEVKRVRRTRTAFCLAIGFVGAILALLRALELSVDKTQIDPYLAIGLGMVAFAAVGLAYSALNILASTGGQAREPDVRQARRIQHLLKWEVEQGSTSKNTVKLWSVFEAADEDSVKQKSRAMSHADLVMELRELLTLFAATHPEDKLVICIDELDKLDKPESLVSVINELKDLFHIQGVHFVVAVSTDALSSFEQRGLPVRDAFDSAFDVIVESGCLTLAESVEVIKARATGFAPLIAMFCHAWSGGLARDLLRSARMAVEFQRRSSSALTMVDLVSHIVLHDLRQATAAAVRAAASCDPDVASLWELHVLLETKGTDAGGEVEILAFQAEASEVLRSRVLLGARLVSLATTMSRLDAYWDDSSPKLVGLKSLLEDIAGAAVQITGPEPMRNAAVTKATRRFEPDALALR